MVFDNSRESRQSSGVTIQPPLDLSIIILSYNTRDYLRNCLQSVLNQTKRLTFETIVLDNASSDGTPQMMRSEFPGVAYIYHNRNLGFTKGNNEGIHLSRGRYVLLLNPDTRIVDDALSEMVGFMDAHPDCGVMGCKLLNADGSLQYSCRRFPSYQTALFNRYSILTRLFPENRFSQSYLMSADDHSATREVDWVSGAALMVRREAFSEVGLLDENFIMYSEDVDWCYRMHEAGWKVYFFPEAQIYHYIGQSTSQRLIWSILVRHLSMYRFYKKHYSRSIKSIDYLILTGICLRFCWVIFTSVLGRFLKKRQVVRDG